MSDTELIIVLVAIAIGIGFFLGMLISNWRNPSKGHDQGSRSRDISMVNDDLDASSEIESVSLGSEQTRDKVSTGESGDRERKRIRLNPLDIFAQALQPEVDPPNPFSRSMSEQIDEILQEMLERESIKSRAVRLMELPTKGMVFMVGLDQYHEIDAIPDEEVRKIIKAAVLEWERRATEESLLDEISET